MVDSGTPQRILIVTDAWKPQVNGVVTTVAAIVEVLRRMGHAVKIIEPGLFSTFDLPGYHGIGVAFPLFLAKKVAEIIDQFQPTVMHIETPEFPLGIAARRVCGNKKKPLRFTTAYHTRLPEYLKQWMGVPLVATYTIMRRAHKRSAAVLVPTQSMIEELETRRFRNLRLCGRGVDSERFHPRAAVTDLSRFKLDELRRPVFGYVGRLTLPKNVSGFLELDLPGSKLVVGDGPESAALKRRYPQVKFTGEQTGDALVDLYNFLDVLVFPSRTDTFGLVPWEALACGKPVAAFPVTGPRDTIIHGVTGFMNEDLQQAAIDCLGIKPAVCREFALQNSWVKCAEQLLSHAVYCR
jgi:glycosyltransferase involved in cell wall biosynthesis